MKKFSQVSGANLSDIRKEGIRKEEFLLSNFLKMCFSRLCMTGARVFSGQIIDLG